jgi:hypothetical protein
MSTEWLQEFEEDIAALAKVRAEFMEAILQDPQASSEIFAPVQDGSVDPGDVEAITTAWWERFGAQEVAAVRQELALHWRLVRLYVRLESAPPEVWEAFAREGLQARFEGFAKFLARQFAPQLPPPA